MASNSYILGGLLSRYANRQWAVKRLPRYTQTQHFSLFHVEYGLAIEEDKERHRSDDDVIAKDHHDEGRVVTYCKFINTTVTRTLCRGGANGSSDSSVPPQLRIHSQEYTFSWKVNHEEDSGQGDKQDLCSRIGRWVHMRSRLSDESLGYRNHLYIHVGELTIQKCRLDLRTFYLALFVNTIIYVDIDVSCPRCYQRTALYCLCCQELWWSITMRIRLHCELVLCKTMNIASYVHYPIINSLQSVSTSRSASTHSPKRESLPYTRATSSAFKPAERCLHSPWTPILTCKWKHRSVTNAPISPPRQICLYLQSSDNAADRHEGVIPVDRHDWCTPSVGLSRYAPCIQVE